MAGNLAGMTDEELDLLIKDAMESGIVHGLIPKGTADRMRARLIQMTGGAATGGHQDGCLMCAVRALTEGKPEVWAPETSGQNVSGVVLRMGEDGTNFGSIPFVDLWTGGHGRVRIRAFAIGLRHALDQASAKVGDRLTVNYDGEQVVNSARYGQRPYKVFSASVQRGH